MADDSPLFDLSQLSFDEFVSFFFDHDIEAEEFWYQDPVLATQGIFHESGIQSSSTIVEHMTRLFTNFAEVVSAFSLPQINVGMWAMFGPAPFELHNHLWLPTIQLSARLACIRSMYFVYSDFVSKSQVQVMEGCFDMWWDFVASDFWAYLHFTEKVPEGDVARLHHEHRALLDCMFETLSQILVLPDERTHGYALHGLGHLHHPGVRKLVQNFIDENRAKMSAEGIRWVEMCRDGTVM
jgi:hypothetical protein